MRGHLGALLRADALGTLDGERAGHAQGPRREDEREHRGDDERGEDDVARGAQRARGLQEHEPCGDEQRGAEALAGDVGDALGRFDRRGHRGDGRPVGGGRGACADPAAPQQRDAARDERERPGDGIRDPEAHPPQRQHAR